MKMKPVPKLLLIVAAVGAVGYGINTYLEHRAAIQAANPPAPVAVVAEPAAPAVTVVQPAPVPVPQEVTAPTVTSPSDRGLDAVLKNAGKK